jgi:hypothetical protein
VLATAPPGAYPQLVGASNLQQMCGDGGGDAGCVRVVAVVVW